MPTLITLVVIVGAIIALAALAFGGLRTSIFFTVKTQENVIVERFGKFKKVAKPGLNIKVPFVETTTRPISLRVRQLEVNIETKTKDDGPGRPVRARILHAGRSQPTVLDICCSCGINAALLRCELLSAIRSARRGVDG